MKKKNKFTFDQLAEFQAQATEDTFIEILGPALGKHMWTKFVANVHQLPVYALDNVTRRRLAEYIETIKIL